jgi:hypothetical protein
VQSECSVGGVQSECSVGGVQSECWWVKRCLLAEHRRYFTTFVVSCFAMSKESVARRRLEKLKVNISLAERAHFQKCSSSSS